jgi:hypothetical protein
VVRVGGLLEVGQMAVDALGRQTLVDAAGVAAGAVERCVGADQRIDAVGEGGVLP